jgi:hypothetical protein
MRARKSRRGQWKRAWLLQALPGFENLDNLPPLLTKPVIGNNLGVPLRYSSTYLQREEIGNLIDLD